MLLSKEQRLKYIGFNDFWFIIVGSFLLSFVTDYIFNGGSFFRYSFTEAFVNWCISLFFCFSNWFIMRTAMIYFRKKFPNFKDSLKRIAILFFAMTATILLVDQLGSIILSYVFGDSYHHGERAFIILPIFLISTMMLAIYEAIYFYHRLKKSVQDEEQAKQVIIQANLDALRNQAQPHFLFNSLNTLRDIIDQDPKEDAKEFVNKLSDVYRFILESGNANLIPLSAELKFAKAYMHIQSERFGSNLKVLWHIDESSIGMLIAPMSLQLLLENAIKHNIISRSTPLEIIVRSSKDRLIVENKIQDKSTQIASTKLGLKNIEKRYSLISEKPMKVEKTNGQFVVTLPLLASSSQTKSHEYTHH